MPVPEGAVVSIAQPATVKVRATRAPFAGVSIDITGLRMRMTEAVALLNEAVTVLCA